MNKPHGTTDTRPLIKPERTHNMSSSQIVPQNPPLRGTADQDKTPSLFGQIASIRGVQTLRVADSIISNCIIPAGMITRQARMPDVRPAVNGGAA